jgi:hypothetical protein
MYINCYNLPGKYLSEESLICFVILPCSSPINCLKVITDQLIATGDDDGCVKVSGWSKAMNIVYNYTIATKYLDELQCFENAFENVSYIAFHSFISFLIRLFVCSFIHSFTHILTQLLIHSFFLMHSYSFFHLIIDMGQTDSSVYHGGKR